MNTAHTIYLPEGAGAKGQRFTKSGITSCRSRSRTMADIIFRSVERDDVQELKALHMECFPIQYDDIFFENICNGKGFKNASLYTQVAVELESSRIVGCILGQFTETSKCEDNGFFLELKSPAGEVFYILTLGLREEYRRSGLGTALLLESLSHAKQNTNCGAVYLHVIHYNQAAMKFYEKNGFIFLRELDEFYVIEKVQHSAYLYILFINGFGPPLLTRIYQKARIIRDTGFRFIFSWISSFIPKTNFLASSTGNNNNGKNSDNITNNHVRDIRGEVRDSKGKKSTFISKSNEMLICTDCQNEKILEI